MPDSNFVGNYLKAKEDLPIMVMQPNGQFKTFDTLRAGETYPIAVYAIMHISGMNYARFQVRPDSYAIYPGSNYSYIPFTLMQVYEPQDKAVQPTVVETWFQSLGKSTYNLVLLGLGAWVLGKWLGKGK